ncbi:hypothetical protein HPB49_012224 [Dermacentor silvarum]|uniref:Uncharacterized protein n=1 Tax=Dermacentor silvarum TaxID=543639 RepID=A0ACB8C3K0_DERSI|nr:hypothetical protein HPB49_012224 [Dermacentor silvarum]
MLQQGINVVGYLTPSAGMEDPTWNLRNPTVCTAKLWHQKWASTASFQIDEVAKRRQKNFDRQHAASHLPPLESGGAAWVHDIQTTATVLSPAAKPRSYVVKTPSEIIIRNHINLELFSETTKLCPTTARGEESNANAAGDSCVQPSDHPASRCAAQGDET